MFPLGRDMDSAVADEFGFHIRRGDQMVDAAFPIHTHERCLVLISRSLE